MAKREKDEDAPSSSESLRQLARLAALWRSQDYAEGLNPVQWEALRYLAFANRFSNTPGALARYLGATKGTISQTIASLEKKGLVQKSARAGDHRSVGLSLTEQAQTLLARDPRQGAQAAVENLRPKVQRRFAQALDALVATIAPTAGGASFGNCLSCRFYRENGPGADPVCMHFEAALADGDPTLLCIAHQAR